MTDFLHIGRVANTHGVKGFIKVLPTTDDIKRFEVLKKVTLENSKGQDTAYKIKSVKYSGQFVLLKLEGVNTMDDAMMLKRDIIKISRDQALPLEDDENFICDLIGLEVFDMDDTFLGPLVDVIQTGANDVYVIDNGSKNGLMLPAMKQWVHTLDIKAGKMVVSLPDGLLDL